MIDETFKSLKEAEERMNELQRATGGGTHRAARDTKSFWFVVIKDGEGYYIENSSSYDDINKLQSPNFLIVARAENPAKK